MADTAPTRRLNVGFILARRFTLGAFANFVDVLRLAADEGDRSRPILCEWQVLSATMNPVTSSSGISVQPQARLGDPARFDYIVVVGGLIDEIENLNPAYVRFLENAASKDVPIAGLCTGGFILHRAGLMDGYRCCVSWFHHDDFLSQFDGIEPVSDQIFVVDRDRLTCSGGASSAHLAAWLVARHIGEAAARKSLGIMIIEEAMTGDRPQPGPPGGLTSADPVVRRALQLIRTHLDAPLSTVELARRLDTGRRQLERRFAHSLGLSPNEARHRIMLEAAERRLQRSSDTIAEIAAEAGFCDASHFSRVFRKQHGITPGVWRAEARPELAAPEAANA